MLTLNDGRAELWQWDTGRTLAVDADCSQVHFSNKVFGRSIDVDVADGTAIIPDVLLQTDNDLNVWAFVGTAENGYTKISKTFKVNRRNKPADYVFTPTEQTTLAELSGRLDRIEESQDPDAIKNAVEDYLEQNPVEVPVKSVNGKTGAVELKASDVGAISQEDLQNATNEALAQAKESGEFDGPPGDDYVLTDADRQEIAKIAAGLVEVPGSGAWELIGEITSDGTGNSAGLAFPVNFSEWRELFITVKTVANAKVVTRLLLSNLVVWYNGQILVMPPNGSQSFLYQCIIKRIDGRVYPFAGYASGYPNSDKAMTPVASPRANFLATDFNYIRVDTNNNAEFPAVEAGTELKVWGCR